MAHGDFVWCDLSTLDIESTKKFYAGVFGWTYEATSQPDGTGYELASTDAGPVAGIFSMPQKFREIGLPSFWMSYISVDDIGRAVETAKKLGGKVEVGPIAWSEGASIALVRDPLGAGFTLYQGDATPRVPAPPHGGMAWNALYVDDVSAVRDFYREVFDWTIATTANAEGAFGVRNSAGETISAIFEIEEAIKGKYQYWGVYFAVDSVNETEQKVRRAGGNILYREEGSLLVQDPDGAAFFVAPAGKQVAGSKPAAAPGGMKWKTLLALAAIVLAVAFELNWFWGVLFLMWTLPALRTGTTFLVEPVSRAGSPVLYWTILAVWVGLSLYVIAADLSPWLMSNPA